MELQLLGAWLAIWLGTIWAGIWIWLVGKAWLESLARNPDMKGSYFLSAILALAFAEATAIYALVIAFQLMAK